jgi:PAS domain S-box-containing protein
MTKRKKNSLSGTEAETKTRLSEGIERAVTEPRATAGRRTLIGAIIAAEERARKSERKGTLVTFFLGSPLRKADLDVERIWTLSPVLKVVSNAEGEISAVNPAWTRTLGFSVEETLGRRSVEFMAPEEREAWPERIRKLAAGPRCPNTGPSSSPSMASAVRSNGRQCPRIAAFTVLAETSPRKWRRVSPGGGRGGVAAVAENGSRRPVDWRHRA